MTMTVELYEDSGTAVAGRGTTRIAVENIGWKNSGLDESNSYIYHPITRSETDVVWSYTKYNFMKISGTYAAGARPRIQISGDVAGSAPEGYQSTTKVKLYYKLTNEYETPSNAMDGSLIYVPPGGITVYPKLSTVGPEDAASTYVHHLAGNTTYFSQYLVTQLLVEPGTAFDYGNLGELVVKVFVDEYETTDY